MADEERKIGDDRPAVFAEAEEADVEAYRLHGLKREPERGDES